MTTHDHGRSLRTRRALSRHRRALLGLLAVPVLASLPTGDDATPAADVGLPAPVITAFVPLPADQLRTALFTINSAAGTDMEFIVGVTNAGTGSIMIYDHWEDGFEADLTAPAQATTLVWGDGNPANGDAATVCGSCAGDLLTPGDVISLRNVVSTPRNASVIAYDGQDRVTSTRGFSLTATGWPTSTGPLLADAVSTYDTSRYGRRFVVPIGQDTPFTGGSPPFEYTGLFVMAAHPGTTVQVDLEGDGTFDVTQTVGVGGSVFVNGGLLEGAVVQASEPVQAHLVTGDVAATYESRWFELFPTDYWTNDYLAPVGSAQPNQQTQVFLYNPGDEPITVTPTCPNCTGTLTVGAHASAPFLVPLGEAVRFTSADKFLGVAAIGAASIGPDDTARHDWGHTLVPGNLLTTQVVMGWAPGSSAVPPAHSYSPVWVTAASATTIRVDFDGDPTTGSLGPDCFGMHDQELSISQLQSLLVRDTADHDMTGARLYTCDGTPIAAAWGQDPAPPTPAEAPAIDAGYTVIPSTIVVVDKSAALAVDTNGDGRFGPGDTVEFTIAVSDAGDLALTDVVLDDTLPAGLVYVPDSTVLVAGSAVTPIADDATPPAATRFPLDEAGATLPDLLPGQTVEVRFRTTVIDPPSATLTNLATVTADEATGFDSVAVSLVIADLSVTAVETAGPTHAGDAATFVITVTNDGADPAAGVVVTVGLPVGASVTGTTPSQGTFSTSTGAWSVGTVPAGASRTLTIHATLTGLTNELTAEVTTAAVHDPDSSPAENPLGGPAAPDEDDEAVVSVPLLARADLWVSSTVLAPGPTFIGDLATVRVTVTNDGPSAATGVTVAVPLPAGLVRQSDTGSGAYAPGSGVWTVGGLAAGATATLDIVVRVDVVSAAVTTQVATAAEPDPDSTPGNDVAAEDDQDAVTITVGPRADLAVDIAASPGTVSVGGQTTLTVRVDNSGPSPTGGVGVQVTVPAGLTLLGATPGQGTYDPETGRWTVGSLAVGSDATLTLLVRVDQPGPHPVTAEVVTADEPDPDSTPGNGVAGEDDQRSATVTGLQADLSLAVSVDDPAPLIGDPAVVTVVLTNGGPGTATGVTVTVPLPDALPWVSDDGAGAYDPVTGRWTVPSLAPGASATLRITVTAAGPDPVTVTGQVTAADQPDPDSTPGNDMAAEDDQSGTTISPRSASLSGRIWVDTNRNGRFDGGEVPVAGVTVVLRDAAGTVVATAVTDDTGTYRFRGVRPGTVTVEVDTATLPPELVAQTGDPDPMFDGRTTVVLAEGEEAADLDFGYDPEPEAEAEPFVPFLPFLPATGSGVAGLVMIALALVTVGTVALTASGRRAPQR